MPAFIWQVWPIEWNSGSVMSVTLRVAHWLERHDMSRERDRVDHHVAVRQLRAFGLPGRAGRVKYNRGVVGATSAVRNSAAGRA